MKFKLVNFLRYINRPFFSYFRDNFCPECTNKLVIIKKKVYVKHINDFEYQDMIASCDKDFIGPVNVIYKKFRCENCDKEFFC